MIFVGGAGAMAEAAKAMRKTQRQINDRVAKTRRRAKTGGDYSAADFEAETADFPCSDLCNNCGYLANYEDEDREDPPECPACGGKTWVDLSLEPVTDRIRQLEAEERNKAPTWVKLTVLGATLGLIGLLTAILLMAGYPNLGSLVGFSALLLGPAAYFVLPKWAAISLLRGRERLPQRWHVPAPLPDPSAQPTRTRENVEAKPDGQTVEAPVTQRECLAYQVCVLFDVEHDARPPEWALEEQRSVPFEFDDGTAVEPGKFYLETPVEREKYSRDRSEEKKQFLRARGLHVTDGDFHFYEARLEPGDELQVREFEDGMFVADDPSVRDDAGLPDLLEPTDKVAEAR